MNRTVFYFFCIVVLSNIKLVAQGKYFDRTDSALYSLKSKAMFDNDTMAMRLLTEEIDEREKESKGIKSVKSELDESVKKEDYESAARLKSRYYELSSAQKWKDSLRSRILVYESRAISDTAEMVRNNLFGKTASAIDPAVRDTSLANGGNTTPDPETKMAEPETPSPVAVPKKPAFKGTIEFETIYENVPYLYKGDFENSTSVNYYGENMRRTDETFFSKKYETRHVKVYNYNKGEYLEYYEYKRLKNGEITVTATVGLLSAATNTDEIIQYKHPAGTVLGRECVKTSYRFVGGWSGSIREINAEGVADTSVSSIGYYGQYMPFLYVDYPTQLMANFKEMTMTVRGLRRSNDPLPDDIFSTSPPQGATVRDNRHLMISNPEDRIFLSSKSGERSTIVDSSFESHSTNKPMATIFSSPFFTSYFFRGCKGDTIIVNIGMEKPISVIRLRNWNREGGTLKLFRNAPAVDEFCFVAGDDDIYEIEFQNSNVKDSDVKLKVEKLTRQTQCNKPISYRTIEEVVKSENGITGKTHYKRVPIPD